MTEASPIQPTTPPSHPVGRHLLVDFHGLEPAMLQDPEQLDVNFRASLATAGLNVLHYTSQKFPGEDSGVTGFALLIESHAAYHSYPEFGYLAIDLFTCGDADPHDAVKALSAALSPQTIQVSEHARGVLAESKNAS